MVSELPLRSLSRIRPDLVDAASRGQVLAKIVAKKREDVAARMQARPLSTFGSLERSDRSLLVALQQPGVRFIMECKRASPSRGLIRANFDAVEIANAYASIADAVSVLTDEPYFSGSFEILRTVRAHVSVPVLCKDFVLTPYQVYEARSHGADAILLMMSVLADETSAECLRAAAELGVDCLVEVHDETELSRAIALGAKIIGINNRNLKTLKTDLAVTERLAGLVPTDRVVVSESGIYDRGDVDRLAPHADGFLVGTSLMSQPDLASAARQLVFGRVKICGLRTESDARAAKNAGAIFGGLIFAPKSPRRVDPDTAKRLVAAVDLAWVGVFADENIDTIARLVTDLNLAAVQLHGNEDDEVIDTLRALLPDQDTEIWKSVGVPVDASESSGVQTRRADRILFDSISGGCSGGTGRTFPWQRLTDDSRTQQAVLAGGLDPHNIVAARSTQAWCLDVNSGVENAPGDKSPQKIEALFQSLRGRCRSDHHSSPGPASQRS